MSNDSEQFSPVSKFDPNHLVTDVQHSLAMQVILSGNLQKFIKRISNDLDEFWNFKYI